MTNAIGLTMRMTVAILISWWLWGEVAYDACNEKYDWLASFLRAQVIDENLRTGLEQGLHLLNYVENKYGYNLEQIVLAEWVGGRLISDCIKNCIKGRLELQS